MSGLFVCLPVKTAYTGQTCVHCCCLDVRDPAQVINLNKNNDLKLLRCASCKLANYCSKECQRSDWAKHKGECKLLQLFKMAYQELPLSRDMRLGKATTFLELVLPALQQNAPNSIPLQRIQNNSNLLPTSKQLKGFDKSRFTNFVIYGKTCSICFQNEFCCDNSENGNDTNTALDWKCCPNCQFGWCCSDDHWQLYVPRHTPELCQTYKTSLKIDLFHFQHIKREHDTFLALPQEPIANQWSPQNFPKDWPTYFEERFPDIYPRRQHMPAEFWPAATRLLSQPLTCLYAMYQYGIENFVSSGKQNLVLHIVGAGDFEVPPTHVWEEIMHCLPSVQTMTVQFIGPEACDSLKPPRTELPTFANGCCPVCEQAGRQRLVGMYAYTYHDYAAKYLINEEHDKPDLIVAFNSGIHECDTESWKQSLQVMLDMNVPAYFTSYNEEEAVADFEILKSVQAKMLLDEHDIPKRNPFGEDHHTIEPASKQERGGIDKFFSNSMYGVMFQGRR